MENRLVDFDSVVERLKTFINKYEMNPATPYNDLVEITSVAEDVASLNELRKALSSALKMTKHKLDLTEQYIKTCKEQWASYQEALDQHRLYIMPLAEGQEYFAVCRNCNLECKHESDFCGTDAMCDIAPDRNIHPFDGYEIPGCPYTPYIQTRTFSSSKSNWVDEEFKRGVHLFRTREEAEESIGRELPKHEE